MMTSDNREPKQICTKRSRFGFVYLALASFAIAGFVFCSTLVAAAEKENDGCRKDETKTDQGCAKNPRLIRRTEPEYPPDARRHRVGASVTLQGRLNEQGTVDDIKVVNAEATDVSYIESFQQAAITAFKKWRYRPATLDGKPVPVDLTVTVDFIL